MNLISLDLQLPPMSQIVAERRSAEATARVERQLAATAREMARVRRIGREYKAAAVNRLSGDWPVSQTSAQAEIYRNLRNLRARSRDMARNNPYMKKFLGTVRRNIVGPSGIRLQVRAKKSSDELDEVRNKIVEEAFAEWSLPENCSASGKYSWVDAQGYMVNTMARDGEVLCRFIEADNPFGFALKFYDVAHLDETFNEVLGNGNRVLMSVEVNVHDRPVAYYLTTPQYDLSPALGDGKRLQRVRVPASEIIHLYLPFEDEGATRGVPWAHAAMYHLRVLGQYEEAELINSHLAACKMGFVIPPANDEDAGVNDVDEAGNAIPPEAANITDRSEPGLWQELPPGYDVKTFDPEHPGNNFAPFTSAVLRGAASGLDVSYFSLANDLTAVNYSSARIGLLDDRDTYRTVQEFLINHFCRRVYRAWLARAILTSSLEGVLPSDFDRLKSPDFQARGWAWVDPLKDNAANIMAIKFGLATRSQTLAESGQDFEDVVKRLKEEQDYLQKCGVLTDAADLVALASLASNDDKRG
jgi:lambda family phage portal protein